MKNVPVIRSSTLLGLNSQRKNSVFKNYKDVKAFFQNEIAYQKVLRQNNFAFSLVAVRVNPVDGSHSDKPEIVGFVRLERAVRVQKKNDSDTVLLATLGDLTDEAFRKFVIGKGILTFQIDPKTLHLKAFYMTLPANKRELLL